MLNDLLLEITTKLYIKHKAIHKQTSPSGWDGIWFWSPLWKRWEKCENCDDKISQHMHMCKNGEIQTILWWKKDLQSDHLGVNEGIRLLRSDPHLCFIIKRIFGILDHLKYSNPSLFDQQDICNLGSLQIFIPTCVWVKLFHQDDLRTLILLMIFKSYPWLVTYESIVHLPFGAIHDVGQSLNMIIRGARAKSLSIEHIEFKENDCKTI